MLPLAADEDVDGSARWVPCFRGYGSVYKSQAPPRKHFYPRSHHAFAADSRLSLLRTGPAKAWHPAHAARHENWLA
jgi:hypothetical protein